MLTVSSRRLALLVLLIIFQPRAIHPMKMKTTKVSRAEIWVERVWPVVLGMISPHIAEGSVWAGFLVELGTD
jgi:hypothetical protein